MPAVTGIAYWASVSKPNTHFDPKWTIELVVNQEEAKKLKESLKAVTDNPKAVLQKVEKDEERGGWRVRIEQRCEKADGTPNEAPRVVDSEGEPFTRLIGNGSVVKVLYRTYKSIYKNKEYAKLALKAVKVLELVPYGDDQDEEDFYKAEGKNTNLDLGSDDFDDDL